MNQGDKVKPIEQNTKTPFAEIGVFALLGGLVHSKETSAPSPRRTLLLLPLILASCLLAPTSASAHFARPYLRQITGFHATATGELTAGSPVVRSLSIAAGTFAAGETVTGEGIPANTTVLAVEPATLYLSADATKSNPSAALSAGAEFTRPVGLALDAAGNLWVGDEDPNFTEPWPLDAFEQPSDALLKSLGLSTEAESLAIDLATGTFYASSPQSGIAIYSEAGAPERTIPIEASGSAGGAAPVAFDNSCALHRPAPLTGPACEAFDPAADSLYASSRYTSDPDTLFKFNAKGEPALFEGCGSECATYVKGSEIVGTPDGERFKGLALAVDPANGDIYFSVHEYLEGGNSGPAILIYAPSGRFVRAITSAGVPRLDQEAGYFGGEIEGLAVDPTNGDLLVSLSERNEKQDFGGVDEFDSSGHFLSQITEAAGEPLRGAFAIAAGSQGDVYVINRTENGVGPGLSSVDVYGPGHFTPALRLAPAATEGADPETAVLNGAVNPESTLAPNPSEYGVSDCHFEYVTEAAFKATGFSNLSSGGEKPCEAPAAAAIPKGDEYTSVHAQVSEHVVPGTTYRYRLSATLAGALGGQPETSSVLAFTAPHAPAVSATVANEITSNFAALSADVNPLGADTHYCFEYLTETQFNAEGGFAGAGVQRTAEVDLGPGGPSGSSPEAVFAQLGGLAPETTYRFRLLAENAAGVTPGEEVSFTTQPTVSPLLPDNRAYEMLTPPDKEGAEDMFEPNTGFRFHTADELVSPHNAGVASESGDQFMLATPAAFGPAPADSANVYVFSRHPSGANPVQPEWSYTSLTPPGLAEPLLLAGPFDPLDLSRVAVLDNAGALESESGLTSVNLVGPPGGPYATLHADQPTHNISSDFPPRAERTTILGASHDLSHLVLESNRPLDAAAAGLDPEVPALYESGGGSCTAATGECTLLDVNTRGELLSPCGAALGRGGSTQQGETNASNGSGSAYRAVSADGSKVFFTAPIPLAEAGGAGEHFEADLGCPNAKGENPAQLYLRSEGETTELSSPEAGAPEAGAPKHEARFEGAAEDGSRVFFTDAGELTASDKGVHDTELYEWRPEGAGGALTGGATGECAQPRGCRTRVSAGEPGSAATAGGAAVEHVAAVSADGSHVYFVAAGVLTGANAEGKQPSAGAENLYVYDTATARTAFIAIALTKGDPEAYATPDGRFLLFSSRAHLTPYDSESPECSEKVAPGPCSELYRYDASTESTLCVSCSPGVPAAPTAFNDNVLEGAANGPVRGLSDDGAYAFFDSAAALVSTATNATIDVYEWHEGHGISLISSGTDEDPSYFLDASPDGKNVFFGTHARLVPADTGSEGDLYDARVCTVAEPCVQAPPAEEGLCEGDACAHPAGAPNDASPSSLTFTGPGDLVSELTPKQTVTKKTAAKCKKGYIKKRVKKKEQCVRKTSKKTKKAKKATSDRRAPR
jgi:hypothetical protein